MSQEPDAEYITGEVEATTALPWNPLDTSSYMVHVPIQVTEAAPKHHSRTHGDFISLITAISQAYQQDRYLEMRPLDNLVWDDLDPDAGNTGATFHVTKSNLEFDVVSPQNIKESKVVINRIVSKKTKNRAMTNRDIRSFNRELRILDSFHGTSNIVKLRGVGWLYNLDPVQPMPQPVLMLEEAQHTMRYLVSDQVNLSPRTMMGYFYDLATALSALHTCGVVHGDIAVDNVLLFASYRYDQGIRVPTFIAKLSDFNLAMFDTGAPQSRLGGRFMYMAPEGGNDLTFPELKLTDVYALGILYTVVASKTEDILEIDTLRHAIDTTGGPAGFEHVVLAHNDNDTEGSTLSRKLADLVRTVFNTTIRTDPRKRRLDQLLRKFDAFFGDQRNSRTRDKKLHELQARSITDVAPSDLTISYGKLMNVSGAVKDQIHQGLLRIVSIGDDDLRFAKASFELGVMHFSRYHSPAASPSEGLKQMWTAAENGDLRARTFYGRLQRAHGQVAHPEYSCRRLEWLRTAAGAGYRMASDELARSNYQMARDALDGFAIRNLEALSAKGHVDPISRHIGPQHMLEPHQDLHTSSTEFQIHVAAATGSDDILEWLLSDNPNVLNVRNNFGDTPLLSACRYGQWNTAQELLKRSSDASLSNSLGENALHFLWRFNYKQAKSLLGKLLVAGANPEEEAADSEHVEQWNLVPALIGTPIERLASYNRLDLVELFLRQGLKIVPSNGRQLRRMLLLAIRLHHTDMQKYLIQYAVGGEGFRDNLRPLHKVGWDYNSSRRTYLDAAVLGCVRQTGGGIDVPIEFWQACYHAEHRQTVMEETMEFALQLSGSSKLDENVLDNTILLALSERSYPSFEHLFMTKILHTDGAHARLLSLEKFCWKAISSMSKAIAQDRIRVDKTIVSRPLHRINYIDQVFSERATIAQQALVRGDRTLFHIAVERFGADPALPFYQFDSDRQINCYSAISYTFHKDMWFAHKLFQLSIEPFHPYKTPVEASFDWVHPLAPRWEHPLYHSLRQRSWLLSFWLIERGASIFDEMGCETVVDHVMALEPLPAGTLELMIPSLDDSRSLPWQIPAHLDVHGGYPVLRSIFYAITRMQHLFEGKVPRELTLMWLSLLRQNANVENRPTLADQTVLGMTMQLYQTLLYATGCPLSFELWIVPSVRVRILISPLEAAQASKERFEITVTPVDKAKLWRPQALKRLPVSVLMGSPMDDLSLQVCYRSGLWRHYCFPSHRHKQLRRPIATLLVIVIVIGVISFIVSVYISFSKIGMQRKHRITWVVVMLGLIWILICVGLFGILLAGYGIIGFTLTGAYALVTAVVGPGMIPAEMFSLPDPEQFPVLPFVRSLREWRRRRRGDVSEPQAENNEDTSPTEPVTQDASIDGETSRSREAEGYVYPLAWRRIESGD